MLFRGYHESREVTVAQLVLKLRDRELRRVPIMDVETHVGRDPGNDLIIDNTGVSRHHLTIVYEAGRYYARDCGSSNGLFVNGLPAHREPLENGDSIQLGKFTVIFSEGGGVPATKLRREGVLEPVTPSAALRNPQATTALSPAELERFMHSPGFAGRRVRGPAPADPRVTDPYARQPAIAAPAFASSSTVPARPDLVARARRPVAAPRPNAPTAPTAETMYRDLAVAFAVIVVCLAATLTLILAQS